MDASVFVAKSAEFRGEESKKDCSILGRESCVTKEASMIAEKSTETKGEESKNENQNDSSQNKKEVDVAAAVVDSGDGKTAITAATAESSSQKENNKKKTDSNRILISRTKKPFVFYLNLAKRYIKQHNDIELAALGMAIPTVVTIAEALKRDGLASHKEIKISTVNSKEDYKGHFIQKAKIQIVMGKAEKFDKTDVATTAPKMAAEEKA